MNNEITRTFGPITIDSITEHTFKQGISQAQLRQVVTTTYPSIRVSNSKSDSLFNFSDFKLPEGKSFESTRIVWANLPSDITTEQLTEILAAKPKARIYREISYNVLQVLTEEQKQAIAAGLRTVAEFQDQLRIRTVDQSTGEVVDIDGPPQYRQNFLSLVGKEDVDYRTNVIPGAADVDHTTATATESKTVVAETAPAATAELTL